MAVKEGLQPSEVATFEYVIDRRDTDSYISQEIYPGIHMILDYDDTKMYLLLGTKRAMLIDAGLGNGNLRAFVEPLIGNLPLDVVITHGHPDHIAAMGQFQDRHDVYMNQRDMPMVEHFIERMNLKIDMEQIEPLTEGMHFEMGDRTFTVYEVPGHSAGCIVLFDEQHGLLIAGDAVGSNRATITDSLWMQFPGTSPIDTYLSALRVFRAKVAGKVREIIGGHNDLPLYGEAYLDNLEQAAQLLVDQGEAALVPSLRPTDAWQVVVGDRLSDPNWAAINVAKETCLTAAPEKIATLSNILFQGRTFEPRFEPDQLTYSVALPIEAASLEVTPITNSSRYSTLTINGVATTSGKPQIVALDDANTTIAITVGSPDGSVERTYTLAVSRTSN